MTINHATNRDDLPSGTIKAEHCPDSPQDTLPDTPPDLQLKEVTETQKQHSDECYGLKWEKGVFIPEPLWTVEPSIDAIKAICKGFLVRTTALMDFGELSVEFLTEGAFNKVYHVKALVKSPASYKDQIEMGLANTTREYKFACRVSLPVDPRFKTLSEVATLQFLQLNTSIPVPRVLASNPSAIQDNHLRFEWTLQTFVPGKNLSSVWNELGDAALDRVVRQLADYQAQLFATKFTGIGNLYATEEPAEDSIDKLTIETRQTKPFSIGRIVAVPFFMGCRASLKNNRKGPFSSSSEWLAAQLEIVEAECQLTQENPSEKYELEASRRISALVKRLQSALPKFFPSSDSRLERSVLFHNDLSQENIFVNDQGEITAILDWESSPCVPLWAACDIPSLLQGKDWDSPPDPDEYGSGHNDLLFQDRLLWYQQTRLREVFLSQMRHHSLEWVELFERSRKLRDFRLAVELCDSDLAWRKISQWLDALEQNGVSDNYYQLDME